MSRAPVAVHCRVRIKALYIRIENGSKFGEVLTLRYRVQYLPPT